MSWYLIAPPIRSIEGKHERFDEADYDYLDEHAPYKDWKLVQVLDSDDECERCRDLARRLVEKDLNPVDPDVELEQYTEGECFAADDPRVKGIDTSNPLIPPLKKQK